MFTKRNRSVADVNLIVPDGTRSLYQGAVVWKEFGSMIPDDEIWYTSEIGKQNCSFPDTISHQYENSKGVLKFSGPVTEIPNDAFKNCIIEGVAIPRTLTSIGGSAFSGCSDLNSVVFCEGAQLKSIGDYAFSYCSALKTITVPYSVESINQFAFTHCTGLESVTFEENSQLTELGQLAFSFCSSLKAIKIPSNVTYIESNLFNQCSSLSAITFPRRMTEIAYECLGVCKNLTSITVESGNELFDSRDNCNAIIDEENELVLGCKNTVIPRSVSSIGYAAFANCIGLTGITLPDGIRSIDNNAFEYCNNLTAITLKSMPSMKEKTFNCCDNIQTTILDLTDSEKPYIGKSLEYYPAITRANYHRTLEKGRWGTIVLPFVPESTAGLEFYALESMTTAGGGALTFKKADNVEAGVPYLFRNTSDNADFTLTKTDPVLVLNATTRTADGFTMKGSFQSVQLNGTENENLYYLKDDKFYHATGKINIAPFRAYIEGDGVNKAPLLMLTVAEDGSVTAVPGILDASGDIDETAGIYDLNGNFLSEPQPGQINIIRAKSGKTVKRVF